MMLAFCCSPLEWSWVLYSPGQGWGAHGNWNSPRLFFSCTPVVQVEHGCWLLLQLKLGFFNIYQHEFYNDLYVGMQGNNSWNSNYIWIEVSKPEKWNTYLNPKLVTQAISNLKGTDSTQYLFQLNLVFLFKLLHWVYRFTFDHKPETVSTHLTL